VTQPILTAWMLLVGCRPAGTPDTPPSPTGSAPTDTAGAPTGDSAATPLSGSTADTGTPSSWWASADTAVTGTPPTVVDGPTLVDPPLVDTVPLARQVQVSTAEPTQLTVHVDDGERVLTITFPGEATDHLVPVLGVPAATRIRITVDLHDDDGSLLGLEVGQFTTPAAPSPLPTLEVLAHDPARVEPGYLFFALKSPEPGIDYLIALDDRHRLVWWWDSDGAYGDVRVLPDSGHIVGIHANGATHRDFLGNELLRYAKTPTEPHEIAAPYGSIHHELFPMADGSFWTLCSGSSEVPAYPTDYDAPTVLGGPTDVADECIAHVAADGTLLTEWWATDLLDTERIGFDSLDFTGNGRDWVHLNGLVPTDDGGVIVSARHQGALFAIDAAGQLEWILADPEGWSPTFQPYLLQPVGDVVWPYHQHAPALDDDGLLWVFDNHSYGRTPYTPEEEATDEVSRAVGYRVDPTAMTVEQVHSFEAPAYAPLYSPALGDADPLPVTGNVLADFGFLDGEAGVPNIDLGRGRKSIRLVEFDRDQPDQPALDLRLSSDVDDLSEGYKMYRVEKIGSLYPADVEVSY